MEKSGKKKKKHKEKTKADASPDVDKSKEEEEEEVLYLGSEVVYLYHPLNPKLTPPSSSPNSTVAPASLTSSMPALHTSVLVRSLPSHLQPLY